MQIFLLVTFFFLHLNQILTLFSIWNPSNPHFTVLYHHYDIYFRFFVKFQNREFSLNIEYKFNNQDFVTLSNPETKKDIASMLVAKGVLLVEKRREKRLQKLVSEYYVAQDTAKKNRVSTRCL